MDVFKDRKKKRKQDKKKRNLSPSQSGEDLGDPAGKCERRSSSTTSPGEKGGGGKGNAGPQFYERADSGNVPLNGETPKNGAKAKAKLKGKAMSSENLSSNVRDDPAAIENGGSGQKQKQKKKNNQVERGRAKKKESPRGPQLDQPTSPLPSSTSSHSQVPSTPDPSRMSLNDDPGETSTPNQPQSCLPQTTFIEPPPSDALFITIPRIERPPSLPGQPESSLAVPAARHFIGKYYAHFDGSLPGAQIGNLIRHYTPKAQKSVSIGGAHSVVTGGRDIAAQILNLNGTAFAVRGVVAQDTADGKGVHILVTGTAQTSLNGTAGGVLASFAHSISLVPIDDSVSRIDGISPALRDAFDAGFPFQIHNDALALLSGDAGPVTPAPILQPAPPPGLF